jgi:hypothetical protein
MASIWNVFECQVKRVNETRTTWSCIVVTEKNSYFGSVFNTLSHLTSLEMVPVSREISPVMQSNLAILQVYSASLLMPSSQFKVCYARGQMGKTHSNGQGEQCVLVDAQLPIPWAKGENCTLKWTRWTVRTKITLYIATIMSSWHSGHFHFGSLVQGPNEIWHNSAGIPNNDRPFPSMSRLPPIPRAHSCHRAVLLSVWPQQCHECNGNNRRRTMHLYRVAVVRSGGTRVNSV